MFTIPPRKEKLPDDRMVLFSKRSYSLYTREKEAVTLKHFNKDKMSESNL